MREPGAAPTEEMAMNCRAPAVRAARAKPSTASWSTASNAGQLPAFFQVVPSVETATSSRSLGETRGPLAGRSDDLSRRRNRMRGGRGRAGRASRQSKGRATGRVSPRRADAGRRASRSGPAGGPGRSASRGWRWRSGRSSGDIVADRAQARACSPSPRCQPAGRQSGRARKVAARSATMRCASTRIGVSAALS